MFNLFGRKPTLPVLLVAGLALTGCNQLNGTDIVTVDDDGDTVGGVVDAPGPTELKCAYPPGTGVATGDVVPVDRQWQGFAEAATAASELNISDYYDCDGSRGIDAIMVDTSQYG